MRKNRKGFTMIELLAALTIIGILLLIAVPGVSTLMKRFREDYYKELEKDLVSFAQDFYNDNKLYRPEGELRSSYVSVKSLINKKYLEKLVDYKGKTCSLTETDSYVIVIYKGQGKYEYKACISCPNDDYNSNRDKTYCESAWRTNDNIRYGFSDSEDNAIYIYYGTSKDEVKKKLLKGINVIKTNRENEVLEEVVLSNKEGILPSDIDKLNTSPILDSTNRKETILHYNHGGNSTELKTVVYKHKAPKVEMTKQDGSNYTSGTWTNSLTIKLSTNDDLFEKSNTSVSNFQMSIDGGSFQNVDCQMKTASTCTVAITSNVHAKYSFRIVTNENKYSDITNEYFIKVDVNKPMITINPTEQSVIVRVGETGGNFTFTLSAEDTGGSGIGGYPKYAMSSKNKEEPTSWTSFEGTVSPQKWFDNGKGKQYVWLKAVDNAGNVFTKCSNQFYFKYQIIYDLNGGTGANITQYKTDGIIANIVSNQPTREDYEFQGWGTSPNGSVAYKAGDAYRYDRPITLYAIWKASPKAKVTFDANGGTPNKMREVLIGSNITLPSANREGYKMTGWYTSTTGTTKVGSVGDTYKVEENITLYAHWLKADCRAVESEWGNTDKYSIIEVTATGDNISRIYYKRKDADDYSYTSSISGLSLSQRLKEPYVEQPYYKFMYYAEDMLNNRTDPSSCYSKYDNLKPYTPHVKLATLYSDAELLEDTCASLSTVSTRDATCTIRIRGGDRATIAYSVNSTDLASTDASGMSGLKYKKTKYIYADGTSCTNTWDYEKSEGSSACEKSSTVVYSVVDKAGNESGKLTFVYERISS